MLTAEQTIAISRKYGAHRYPFVVEHDQHDFVKVNSGLETVKIFFFNMRRADRSLGISWPGLAPCRFAM